MTPHSDPLAGRHPGSAAAKLSSRIATALLTLGESCLGWDRIDRWLAAWVSRAAARTVRHHELSHLLGAIRGADRLRLLHVLSCGTCRRQAGSELSQEIYDQVADRVCRQQGFDYTE
jgi:hypothetical protein